jgi:hypothetical protein
MSVLDAARLRTFSNKSAFDDVSPSTLDVSSVFDDVSPLTLNLSPSLDDLSSSFDDLSSSFDDFSLRMSLACPFIFPSNSCRSDSIASLCGAAVSGSGLVSVRRPIPCGFEGTGLRVVR